MTGNYRPENTQDLLAYLNVADADGLIADLSAVFGAELTERLEREDGSVMHAEMRIGDTMIMLAQVTGDAQQTRSILYVYVPDADATYARAMSAGLESLRAPEVTYYGHRNAAFADREGNQWWLATKVDDLSQDELQDLARQQSRPDA